MVLEHAGTTPVEGANAPPEEAHMARDFSFLQVLIIGWNIMNVFGGLSYLFVVGFSAGGLPSIIYGFLGSWVCTMCLIAILAECASMFPTAGGAYHFAVFLSPPKYRRVVGYVIGWFDYLGMVFAASAINSILAGLVMAMVIIWNSDFVIPGRWTLFLLYEGFTAISWLVNVFAVRSIPVLSNCGCYITLAGFVAFTITLLALAPKASAESVFVTVYDATGYDNKNMAILLGTYTAMSALGGLDSACHIAEEIHQPAKMIPKILYIAMITQFFMGAAWILVVGFSITDQDTIVKSSTGIPILELIRQACHGSNVAAMVFALVLFFNQFGTVVGATLAASRQGFAFARDGGMFFNERLTYISTRFRVPTNSLHVPFAINFILGFVYLASSQGFNALLGGTMGFALLSYASPAAVMLCTGRSKLEKTPFSLGKLGYPCAVVSVLYGILVVILSLVPQEHPITTLNMNYAIVIIFGSLLLMLVAWYSGANKLYHPPSFEVFLATIVPPSEAFEFAAAGQDKMNLEDKIAIGNAVA